MPYASYEDYIMVFQGERIPQEAFPAAVREASAYVDRVTYGRLKTMEAVPAAVCMAVCAAAEAVWDGQTIRAAHPAGVASETVGSHSVTYTDPGALQAHTTAAMASAVDLYLPLSHPLRYAGVD